VPAIPIVAGPGEPPAKSQQIHTAMNSGVIKDSIQLVDIGA
jgi:hypothetical protein